jgi:uncharacterized membrane protein YuzA (DUF378 family)
VNAGKAMKQLNTVTLALTIFGGLVIGIGGAVNFDLFGMILGIDVWWDRAAAILIGLAALYQIYPLVTALAGAGSKAHPAHP